MAFFSDVLGPGPDGYQNMRYQNLKSTHSLFSRSGDADPDCDLDHPNVTVSTKV